MRKENFSKPKLVYEQPCCNPLVIRFEEGILDGSAVRYGVLGAAGDETDDVDYGEF